MTGRQSGTMGSQMQGLLTKIWISLTTLSSGAALINFSSVLHSPVEIIGEENHKEFS